MKKILKIVGFAVIGFMIIVSFALFYLSRGLDKGQQIELSSFDLASVEDGVYTGTFDFQRWSNTVEVTVSNHTITKIVVLDDMQFVKEGVSQEVFQMIITIQDIPEDLVSEATITSKAYIKAIENALKND